ncbi:MAG: histidine ammonia-lyase [Actinobacteria bacterium]|nr:histidine ammonia-lyase [Actinomycetota bacterium]
MRGVEQVSQDGPASRSAVGRVVLGADGISPQDVVAVARHGASTTLSTSARQALERAHRQVAAMAGRPDPVYGVSTGFGALAVRRIPVERRRDLQRALIRSHAAGMGPAIENEVVRAMMLLRARTLAMGRSGVRVEVVELLLAMLGAGITPLVPEHGSLGCSGDLAPLAHVALALLGEGDVEVDGVHTTAAEALAAAGLEPLTLEEKEGLALVNGTDGMLAMLVLACTDIGAVLRTADVAAAMSVEALLGTAAAFAPDVLGLRPHPGQQASGANLVRLLEGSPIVASHLDGDVRVQDAYSLRCAPQVAGAARDTLDHARRVVDRELRATIDNPVILPDGRVASNGNFHGAPLALACDFLAIALADLGAMSERRTDRLLDPARSHGLPAFLADDPGVDSGLMIAQYTAAALVAENRRLAVPASADTVPTSAMQEDHVSMGWAAARKLRTVIANTVKILAIEVTAAGRAIELRRPLTPAPASAAVLRRLREDVPGPGMDRYLAPELAAAEALVTGGGLVRAVEDVVGPLA